jgi:hypothetical protein
MDFSKAFDKFSHSPLQHTLDHYGIRGKTGHDVSHFASLSRSDCSAFLHLDLMKLSSMQLCRLRKLSLLMLSLLAYPIKFNYTLHGHSLEHVTSAKYLGCTRTSDLKWGPHINNICNKANSAIGFLHHGQPGVCSSAF